jgi:hypothetical protein
MNYEPSYAIDEFCAAERISRSMFYKLGKQGRGPRTFNVGSAVRISPEARREWRRTLEADAAPDGDAARGIAKRGHAYRAAHAEPDAA